MSNLDKSLDEILSSKPRVGSRGTAIRKDRKKTLSTKKRLGTRTKPTSGTSASKGASPSAAGSQKKLKGDIAQYATRALFSNLPGDVSEKAVRTYLQQQVGSVQSVTGNYNSHGKSTGTFTVTFKEAGKAAEALAKFNGAKLDGGAKEMRVEILYDPTRPAPKSNDLSSRVKLAAAPGAGASKKKRTSPRKERAKAKAAGSDKMEVERDASAGNSTNKSRKDRNSAKKTRRAPKTSEELDADMDAYFAGKDAVIEV